MDEKRLREKIKEVISETFYTWMKGSVPENQLISLVDSIIKIIKEEKG